MRHSRNPSTSIGLKKPITINQNGDVLDGHHRLKTYKELNIPSRFVVEPPFEHDVDERILREGGRPQAEAPNAGPEGQTSTCTQADYEEKASTCFWAARA